MDDVTQAFILINEIDETLHAKLSTIRASAGDRSTAEENLPCPKCGDSGYEEFNSGGIWKGADIKCRYDICDCVCGDDLRREIEGRPVFNNPAQHPDGNAALDQQP